MEDRVLIIYPLILFHYAVKKDDLTIEMPDRKTVKPSIHAGFKPIRRFKYVALVELSQLSQYVFAYWDRFTGTEILIKNNGLQQYLTIVPVSQ